MPMPTLYEKLQTAENVNIYLKGARGRYIDVMRAFEDAPGIVAVAKTLSDEPLPEIAVPDYQRKIIENATANPILLNALQGKQTIEQKLEELAERYPHKRIFPSRENLQHNQEVEELGELVSHVGRLKTGGVLASENLLSGAGFMITLTYAIMLPIVGAIHFNDKGTEASQQSLQTMRYAFLVFVPAVMAVLGGLMGYALANNSSSIETAKEQSHYIDIKIAELYARKISVIAPSEKQLIVEDL